MSETKTYRLEGLSCTNCAAKFEKNIRNIVTVEDVQLNFGASKITIQGEASIEQLEKAGAFDDIKVLPENVRINKTKEPFWKKKANITALISLVFVFLGYIFYFNYGENHVVTIGLFLAAIIIGGYQMFIEGFKNLFKLDFNMKTLMTIAVIGAAIIGEWAEGAVVVFLFAVSEALEDYSIDKARESIRSLMDIAPNTALIKRADQEIEMKVEDIQIGDIMLVKPGQRIAMDGEVIKGESYISEAAITGESLPIFKSIGQDVFAGSINEEGFLEVKVTKHVEDTTIAKIIHLVEEAQAEKAPSQKFVDRFAKYYTPAIMLIALFVAIVPPLLFSADWSTWVYSGLAVLVVGCPCALVISTPVAIVTAIGNAARHGVLIKGGVHLEEAGHLRAVAFDKTGTLTEGTPRVTDVIPLNDTDEQDVLSIAHTIESYSEHPLATAIVHYAKEAQVPKYKAEAFQSITGKGAKATIEHTEYYIGSPAFFNTEQTIPETIQETINALQRDGKTVMVLGTKTKTLGLIAVADRLRKESRDIIDTLHQIGIEKTIMLTGDNENTGHAIGRELGISEVKAELLPDEKLEVIKNLKQQYGKTAMVGDGINDAPALAGSSVGIAMGGAGTDAALETADIALMGDDLTKLPYTVALSRKTLSIIKQNISFALGLKLLALLFVIPGWLTLWIAIFADMGATLIVTLNSLRLIRSKYESA
ncbi:MAG TPA: heavy metal translocating P-type ATPase [Cerasibacillus sp.]|uniref:heavy metal translocating P-type ATPase n=1 Tax=Cerasibacillus sp. TaxID=2498711 RepID=UPI002F418B2A